MKRVLSHFLVLVFVLMLLPVSAIAEGEGPCTLTEGCTLAEGHEGSCSVPEPPAPVEEPTPVEEPPAPVDEPTPAEEPAPVEKPEADDKTVAVTAVTVRTRTEGASLALAIGDTLQLDATVCPDNAANPAVTWSSVNEAVAVVDETGLVTALSAGTADIRATADGVHGELAVTVADAEAVEEPAAETPCDQLGCTLTGEHEEHHTEDLCIKTPNCRLLNNHEGECEVETAEDRLRAAMESYGGVKLVFTEDVLLSADLSIPAEMELELQGSLTVTDGVRLTNRGSLRLSGVTRVYGTVDNAENATLVIQLDAALSGEEYAFLLAGSTEENEAGTLLNAGEIQLYSKMVIGEDVVFSEEQNPIILFEGGSAIGAKEGQTVAAGALAPSFAAYLAESGQTGVIEINTDLSIDVTYAVQAGEMLLINGGVVTVLPEMSLANGGLIRIAGGELVIQNGAALKNASFIEVTGEGKLTVQEGGVYETEGKAILSLDCSDPADSAEISGVARSSIEYALFASSRSALMDVLALDGYAFVTAYVHDPDILSKADFSIPSGKAVSCLAGE